MFDMKKIFSPHNFFNFKTAAFILYIILTMAVLIAIQNYEYTKEMIKSCIEKEMLIENTRDGWVGFSCYFHPYSWYLIYLNFPGILIVNKLDQIFKISAMPNGFISSTVSSLMIPFQAIFSVVSYIFIGHIIDVSVKIIKNRFRHTKT